MDLAANYEIAGTAEFIRARGFTRVALQFPDELLKESAAVARALRRELGPGVRLFVMADAAYGSCCVDEIGASHVDAQCVVHYGHACMSPTSKLPALFVFGKALIDMNGCVESLRECVSNSSKPILALYGLEYAHALQNIIALMDEQLDESKPKVLYAEVTCSVVEPSEDHKTDKEQLKSHNGENLKDGENEVIFRSDQCHELKSGTRHSLGGLTWNIPVDHRMEDYVLFWIGSENSAFVNVVLTFNNSEIVRYDPQDNRLLKDFSHLKRILRRRYYLVEKAKDANIVGILVGTLGVAGYLHIIHQMKELIEGAGKKSYIFVMGRPNSAKLANFPECDVFVYVSCAQTALLDSKDFLAPVITPFEAVLAFSSGRQWTGEYVMEFQDLMVSSAPEVANNTGEARFSFIHGGYVEDTQPDENGDTEDTTVALAELTEKALKLRNQCSDLFKGTAKSGTEYLISRSYQGLNTNYENLPSKSYVVGRTGRASAYEDEKSKQLEV